MDDEFVVVDLETTGLVPSRDRILEIGAIKVKSGKMTEEFSVLVNPRREISRTIVELTGITNEMAANGINGEEAIRAFLEFSEGLPLVGHNIMFDYSFLKFAAADARLELESRALDTLLLARKYLPQLESCRLTALCEYFHISHTNAHRALGDAKVTLLLLQKLKELYEEGNEEDFIFKPLQYRVKKRVPITKHQKGYLLDLAKYHKIELSVEVDSLTKNEASRVIDKIIFQYGRIKR